MSTLKKTLLLGTTSALALSGMAGSFAVAATPDTDTQEAPVAAESQDAAYYKTDIVTIDDVQGTFAFTQNEVSSNATFSNMAEASAYMCNSQGHLVKDDSTLSEDWAITISGKVQNPQVFTMQEMTKSPAVQKMTMACTCMGNPADGRETGNAEVTGIPVSVILEEVGIEEGANTIVFTSADGYEVAVPLKYVVQRYCPIVFDINGEPIPEVMGGTNQLWLGSTSANYFARDIVNITLEERETPPPMPSSDEARAAYQNLPNVGILLGGEIQ